MEFKYNNIIFDENLIKELFFFVVSYHELLKNVIYDEYVVKSICEYSDGYTQHVAYISYLRYGQTFIRRVFVSNSDIEIFIISNRDSKLKYILE